MFTFLFIFACVWCVYLFLLIGAAMIHGTPVANMAVKFFDKSWML